MKGKRYRSLLQFIIGTAFLFGLFFLVTCSIRTNPKPNLVLIVIDTLRADHLGCYGYNKIRTPNIDAFARTGVLVENAISHVPVTLPALSTIMTSTLPPTTGVHYNEGFFLESSAHTQAEILRGEGYETIAVVGAVVLDSVTGISQGFNSYDDDFPAFSAYTPGTRMLQSQFGFTQRRAEEVTDQALELTGSLDEDAPFFLFLHYFDPHFPKDPPPPYTPDLDLSPGESNLEKQIQLYDGEIAYTDEHIGRLLKGLEEQGLLENTLVILTADHGEGLHEHGESTHGYFVYDQTVHIPLIFSMPKLLPQGEIYKGLAGHIDIAPTAFDILGIKWQDRYNFQGKSLYPFEAEKGPDFSYIETAAPFIWFGWSGFRGVRSLEWKYIEAPREELYNLTVDPHETENLIDKMPQVADSLRRIMEEMLVDVEVYQGENTGQEMSTMKDSYTDASYFEKLRALGYISAAEGEIQSTYEEIFDSTLPDPKDKLPDFYASNRSIYSMRLGLAFIETDSLEIALEHFISAVEQDSSNVEACFYLGLTYMNLRDYEMAYEKFENALDIDPTHIKSRLALTDLYLIRGDSALARAELEGAVQVGIYTQKEIVLAVRLWERLGDMKKALEAMKSVLTLLPGDIPTQLYIGELYLTDGNVDSAFAYLEPIKETLAEGDTLITRVHYALGKCYYSRGELSIAEGLFQRVVSLDSTLAGGYNQLGLIYDDREEYETALGYYERALALDEGMYDVLANLGVLKYKAGRYRDSREEFERYLSHVKDEIEADRLKEFIEHIKTLEGSGG